MWVSDYVELTLNYGRKDDATPTTLHFTPVKLNAIAL
jgi:hypothetical protein